MYELAKALRAKITALVIENERRQIMTGRLQADLTDVRLRLDEEIALNEELQLRLRDAAGQ